MGAYVSEWGDEQHKVHQVASIIFLYQGVIAGNPVEPLNIGRVDTTLVHYSEFLIGGLLKSCMIGDKRATTKKRHVCIMILVERVDYIIQYNSCNKSSSLLERCREHLYIKLLWHDLLRDFFRSFSHGPASFTWLQQVAFFHCYRAGTMMSLS